MHTPETGKNYYIVRRKAAYRMRLHIGRQNFHNPVDIIDELYFYDNVNERLSAFRFIYGDNYKGSTCAMWRIRVLAVANNSISLHPIYSTQGISCIRMLRIKISAYSLTM